MPLYVASGAGCGLCVYACGRNLMNYPDIVCVALLRLDPPAILIVYSWLTLSHYI